MAQHFTIKSRSHINFSRKAKNGSRIQPGLARGMDRASYSYTLSSKPTQLLQISHYYPVAIRLLVMLGAPLTFDTLEDQGCVNEKSELCQKSV